jgi:hypothetical protein
LGRIRLEWPCRAQGKGEGSAEEKLFAAPNYFFCTFPHFSALFRTLALFSADFALAGPFYRVIVNCGSGMQATVSRSGRAIARFFQHERSYFFGRSGRGCPAVGLRALR